MNDWPEQCEVEDCTERPIVGFAHGSSIIYLCGLHFGKRLAGITAIIERARELPTRR